MSPARGRRARRRGASAPAFRGIAWPSPALLLLALLATGVPLFASNPFAEFSDQTAMPRLAATAWLTGVALIALSWVGAWAAVPWRAVRWPCLALATFIAVELIATVAGVDPVRGLLGETGRYQGFLPYIMYAALMLAALAATARGAPPRVLLWGLFAGGLLSAFYGLLQRADLDWVDWAGLPEGRIGGAFAQPNILAIELVVAAAASTGLWQDADARARRIVGAGIVVMAAALLFTESRGGVVGAAIVIVVLLAFYVRRLPSWRAMRSIAAAALIAVAFVLVLPAGRDAVRRIVSTGDLSEASVSEHVSVWELSLEIARDRPIIGAGPDAFPIIFGEYRSADQRAFGTRNVRPESTHNFLLDQLVDAGVVGVLAWAALIAACAWLALRRLPALDPSRRAVVVAMIAALAGYYGDVFFSFGQSMTGWMPWLLLGALIGTAVTSDASDEQPPAPAGVEIAVRAGAAAGGVVLVILGVMVAVGDWQSARAGAQATQGDLAGAVETARSATRWDPLQPQYLVQLGFLQVAAANGSSGATQRALREDALDTHHRLNTRFAPSAAGLAREAEAQANVAFETEADRERVFDLLERAVRLDPNSAEVRRGVAEFYTTVGEDERAAPHLAWMREHGIEPAPAP